MNENIYRSANYMGLYILISFIMVFVSIALLIIKLVFMPAISWIWVFSPIWLPQCIMAIALGVYMIYDILKSKYLLRNKYIVKDLFL